MHHYNSHYVILTLVFIAIMMSCSTKKPMLEEKLTGILKCNGIEYIVEEDVVGILDGEKYEIEDNEKTYNEWRKLQNDFVLEFNDFSSKNLKDYELPEWHNGTKCLWVYLYNEKFYNKDFIPKILNILNSNSDCFAQFECYNDKQELIGDIQIYKDIVLFDELFEASGFIKRLCE